MLLQKSWPDRHPISRASVAVDPAILEAFIGVYDFSPTLSVAITLEDGRLMEQVTNRPKLPIFPESPSRFFLKQVNAELEFFTETTGQVSHLVWTQQGQNTRGERRR